MKECMLCGEKLSKYEAKNPRLDSDGDIICDECYSEYYQQQCGICEEYYDIPKCPEETFFVLSEEEGKENDLKKGIYKVLRWPYHGGPLLGPDRIFKNDVEFVKNYDNEESNEICRDCYIEKK